MTESVFRHRPNAAPMPDVNRRAVLANPGFGKTFTDHMLVMRYTAEAGWHDGEIIARAPFQIDPACAVLHYAQEIFEGMKAYRTSDGGAALFRPDANAARFRNSAERMAMPPLPADVFQNAVSALVRVERSWLPASGAGSLYLRPFMFASEVFLGVRPANEFIFAIIASPAGGYFKPGADAISLWVSQKFSRAAPGGTGAAKCGGNYAASLLAQVEAKQAQCDQVVFLDALEGQWVEELGGMNIFFVFADRSIATPPLDGTILPGITRDSVIILARDMGLRVRETPYSLAQWRADAEGGMLAEAFACGTAAVVTPIGQVRGEGFGFSINGGRPGHVTTAIRSALVGIQLRELPDAHGWMRTISL